MQIGLNRAKPLAMCLPLLCLCACGDSSASGAGAISEGEAQSLEEAAEILDEQRLPEGTLPPPPTSQAGPEAEPDAQGEEDQ